MINVVGRERPIQVKWPMTDVPIFRWKNSDVRFWCLVVYQNWTMTSGYCRHASDAEQTSVTSCHRWCWASADSVTHVGNYSISRWLRVRCAAVWQPLSGGWPEWVGVKQTDWRHAWLVMGGMTTFDRVSALSLFSLLKHVPSLFLKLPTYVQTIIL